MQKDLKRSFEPLSSLKTVFWFIWSLRDNLVSVRRKSVPQVRARQDDQYSHRESLVLLKRILSRVLARDLACLGLCWLIVLGTIGRPIGMDRSTDNSNFSGSVRVQTVGRPILRIGRPIDRDSL